MFKVGKVSLCTVLFSIVLTQDAYLDPCLTCEDGFADTELMTNVTPNLKNKVSVNYQSIPLTTIE